MTHISRLLYTGTARWVVALSALMISRVCGQEQLVYTLDGYLSYALAHNPAVQMSRQEYEASGAQVRLASALPGPQIMAEWEKMRDNNRGMITMFGVSQSFPWPGETVWKHRYAQKERELGHEMIRDKQVMVAFDIRETYAMLYETGKALEHSQESKNLLRQTLEIARAAYISGGQRQSDVLRIQIELTRLEDKIFTLQSEGTKLRQTMAQLCATPQALSAPYPDSLSPLQVPSSPDEIEHLARTQNPLLHAAFLKAEASEAMTGMLRQRLLPMTSLSLAYMQAPSNTGGTSGVRFGIGLMLPFWPLGAGSSVASAKYMTHALEQDAQREELQLIADAQRWHTEYLDAGSRISRLASELIPQTQQMLKIMTDEYRGGMAPLSELLDVQRMLLKHQTELAMQQRRREIAAAEIVICCLARF